MAPNDEDKQKQYISPTDISITILNLIDNVVNHPIIDLSSDLNEKEEGLSIIIDGCCKFVTKK
jgi:hypothetical protein